LPTKEGRLMFIKFWFWIGVVGLAIGVVAQPVSAQEPAPAPAAGKDPDLPAPPQANVIAATVNGQPIPEMAVFRGLLREDPKKWVIVRKDVLNYLIDNLLVDQYLTQLKVPVDAKEVEERVAQ